MAQNNNDRQKEQEAAANVIRSDIDRIYSGDDAPHKQAEDEIRAAQDKAARAETKLEEQKNEATAPQQGELPEEWKQYHSSWQSYYQQYYHRYYLNHMHAAKKNEPSTPTTVNVGVIGSGEAEESDEEKQAIQELRDKLLSTVTSRAKEVRKSRHFAPIATALVFAVAFMFLQYNRFLFATVQAYVSPGSINADNIIVDPNTTLKVGPEPKLIIPKINVEAPVIYGVNPADDHAVQENLRSGVVHYPITNASSAPGQNGATVILGHSSNDVFDSGNYKFVFVQLSKLENNDTFYINYEGTRYTYSVKAKEIIDPTEIGKVTAAADKPSVILITCEPPGTALKRLLIFADQISPDPTKATKATSPAKKNTTSITGNSPTFIERLFGAQ